MESQGLGEVAPSTELFDEDRFLLWMEWVTTNLGRDPRRAAIAARAATDASLRGVGFQGAVESATNVWRVTMPPRSRRSIGWLQVVGWILMGGAVSTVVAAVAIFAAALILFRDCGGPIVVCPDMCGGPTVQEPVSPSP